MVKIIFGPVQNWSRNDFDDQNFKKNFRTVFVFTLSVIFIARLVGMTLQYLPSSNIQSILVYSLLNSIIDIIYFFLIVMVLGKIATYYNPVINRINIVMLIFISLIPFYASTIIINLFSSIYFIAVIISLYSIYILYWGIVKYIRIPKKDTVIFFIISLLVIAGFYILMHMIIIYPFFSFI